MEQDSPGLTAFLSAHENGSYEGGLYRIHAISEMPQWTNLVLEAFPDRRGRIFCFSSDWLGRHFAIDMSRRKNGRCQVLMLEPGTGQSLEIPVSFQEFHDVELVNFRNEALASEFYTAWVNAAGQAPTMSQCVGYIKPLFLGGGDVVQNLEITDMEVYWSICGQLLAKVRNLPDGTPIGRVAISQ
jgi:hypothetical protein